MLNNPFKLVRLTSNLQDNPPTVSRDVGASNARDYIVLLTDVVNDGFSD